MYVNVMPPTNAPWPGVGPVRHDLRMARVRPPLACLVALLLAGALVTGCAGGTTPTSASRSAHAAPSPSPSASSTPPAPRLSARQTLARALDRMERADLQGFMETVMADHVAAVDAFGVVRLSTGELRTSARFMDPHHTERQITAAAILAGHQSFFQSSQMGAAMEGCWVRMTPAQTHGALGILARGMGPGSVQALRSVRVTGIDRFHEELHGRLPLDRAVLLFAPVLVGDLVGLDAGLTGSVPVTITVADGQVLHWEASGTDVARALGAAVGDRVPSAALIVGTEFSEQFMDAGPHDEIAAPPHEDIAVSPTGCHGTAT